MDPVTLAALAQAASNALVTAAVTDTWKDLRHRIARCFGRGKPDPQIERRLDATQDQLAAAAPGELESTQAVLAGQWETRFADLLADYPDAAAELDELIKEVQSRSTAIGHSAAAGRDMIAGADRGGFAANVVHGNVAVGPMPPGRTDG